MADWITLIAKRQTAYLCLFCFRGWGWGQQYGIYRIQWSPDEWIVKCPSCNDWQWTTHHCQTHFPITPKRKPKKTLQCAVFHYHFPGFTPSRNHPRQPPRSFRCRWNSNSLWVPGASLKRCPCSTPDLGDTYPTHTGSKKVPKKSQILVNYTPVPLPKKVRLDP